MPNNRTYVDSATLLKINFAGGTDSDNFATRPINQSDSKVSGTSQIRRLGFPAAWATADVSFIVYEDDNYTAGKILYVSDGVDNIPLVIENCLPSTTVSLQAPWTDSVVYLKIVSSVAQPSLDIDVICEPLYQVTA